jgi:hypothetical protein
MISDYDLSRLMRGEEIMMDYTNLHTHKPDPDNPNVCVECGAVKNEED